MKEVDLNQLRDRAYKCACNHGFHDETYSNEHWLMLVISELSEAVEADRKNRHANSEPLKNLEQSNPNDLLKFKECFEETIKDTVEDEIADVAIRLLDFAGIKGIDLSKENDRFNVGIMILLHMMSDPDSLVSSNQTLNNICKEKSVPELAFFLCKYLTRNGTKDEDIDTAIVYETIFTLIIYFAVKNVDLLWHINQKMRYNELRPYKNGKEY